MDGVTAKEFEYWWETNVWRCVLKDNCMVWIPYGHCVCCVALSTAEQVHWSLHLNIVNGELWKAIDEGIRHMMIKDFIGQVQNDCICNKAFESLVPNLERFMRPHTDGSPCTLGTSSGVGTASTVARDDSGNAD